MRKLLSYFCCLIIVFNQIIELLYDKPKKQKYMTEFKEIRSILGAVLVKINE